MAFARFIAGTTLFFLSSIGASYLIALFFPNNGINYIDIIFPILAALVIFFISLSIPAFLIKLADKNTKFIELFFSCIAFAGIWAAEILISGRKEFVAIFFSTFFLILFSAFFSYLSFAIAEKIRGCRAKN